MTPINPISRDQLSEMFAGLRAATRWNVDGPLLWGYFFFGTDQAALGRLRTELHKADYVYVEQFETEDDGVPTGVFVLHVERVEHHTVDSLHQRNEELTATAGTFDVHYDGMDVGALPPKKPSLN